MDKNEINDFFNKQETDKNIFDKLHESTNSISDTKSKLSDLKKQLEADKEIDNKIDSILEPIDQTKKPISKRKSKKTHLEIVENKEEILLPVKQIDYNKTVQFDDTKLNIKQLSFLQSLYFNRLNITKACIDQQIKRSVYYAQLLQPEFKEAIDELNESLVDKAIEVLNITMDQYNDKSAQFILKTLGKKRGFGDSVDINHTGTVNTINFIQIVKNNNDDINE